MARNRRQTSGEAIQKLVREGRGQNELAEYQPWLNGRDVPSRGLSTRRKGWKGSDGGSCMSMKLLASSPQKSKSSIPIGTWTRIRDIHEESCTARPRH